MTDWETCPAVASVPGRLSEAWVFKGTRVHEIKNLDAKVEHENPV